MATKKKSTALVTTTRAARKADFDDAVEDGGGKGLAVVDQDETQAIATQRKYSSNLDFTRDDIQMPKLRLGQGMSQEVADGDAKMGQWLVTGFEPEDKVIIVPMVYCRGRVLNEDDQVICSSNDGINGEGEYGPGSKGNKSGQCARCPKSQWVNAKKGGKNQPPACTFYYSYGIWSETHQQMMTMDLKKTAINAARGLNTLVQQNGWGKFAVELTSILQKGKQGQFAIPVIKPAKVKPQVLETAAEQFSFGR